MTNSVTTNQTFIIAEAGVNHNGSLELALKLIDYAAEAKVDAIKFQTFKAENIVTNTAPKAEYQLKNTAKAETQFEMLKRLELSAEDQRQLIKYSEQKNIQFISTPFDLESMDLLTQEFDIPIIKISSGDINNAPLLIKGARTQKPIIISSGMCTLGDIEDALGVLAFGYTSNKPNPTMDDFKAAYFSEAGQLALQKNVSLLHCTTEYPTPYNEVNLLAMDTLHKAFNLPVGLSDHTEGITIPIAAVARGATIIEKHFTTDRTLPGPDHKASLEPHQLKAMVDSIRAVEESLGSGVKRPAPSELKNMLIARKSLVAARDIKKGEIFTEENLTFKRPGNGQSPLRYWEILGREASRDIEEGELI